MEGSGVCGATTSRELHVPLHLCSGRLCAGHGTCVCHLRELPGVSLCRGCRTLLVLGQSVPVAWGGCGHLGRGLMGGHGDWLVLLGEQHVRG